MRIPVNIRRFMIILDASFIVIGAIIYFTATQETLEVIKNMNINFFMLGILLYIIEVSADALRTKVLIRGTHHKIGLWECYKLIALQVFFDLITPFSIGGQPFQVYVLHKKNVPGGSATTVVVLKLLFAGLFLTLIVIFGLLFYNDLISSSKILILGVKITGFIILFLFAIFILGLYNPAITTGVLTFLFTILWKLKISRHPAKFKKKIMKHILLARNSFDGLVSHRVLYFIIGFFLSCIMMLATILMVVAFIWGFGIELPLIEGIILTSTLIFVITFMPTPGATGLGEGFFFVLYKEIIPKHIIGVVILLWRFFYHYLSAILGAIVSAKYFSELLAEKPGKIKIPEEK